MANYDLGTIGYTIENTGGQKSIAELRQVAEAGLEAHRNTNQLAQSGAKLTQYFASVDKQLTAVNRNMQNHNRYLSQAAQGSNRFGVVTQQAGYQIGDFLVQVQSGTNWMVAFGQQATQLVGILPLMGAGFMGLSAGALVALSAGLGIVIPLVTALGAAYMRTNESAKEGADGINTYADVLKNLTSEIEKNQAAFLKAKYGTETSDQAVALQQQVDLQKQIAEAQQSILQAEQQLEAFRSGRGAAYINLAISNKQEEIRLEKENLKSLQDKLFVLDAQEEAQRMLNGHLSTASGVQARLVAEKQAELQAARELQAATANAYQVYARTRMEASQTAEQVRLIESGMSQAAVDALKFAGIDLASGVSAAAKEAATLAANMGISLNAALSLINLNSSQVYGQVGARGDPRDFLPGGKKYSDEGFKPFVYDPSVGGSGGGSGGGAGDARLNSLIESLRIERETVTAWYEESKALLQSASDSELEILGGKYEAMARLDAEYRQKTFEAQQAQAQMSFQAYSGMFSALSDLLNTFGNQSKGAAVAALVIQKGLAIAQIVTSTAAAQMRAYAELGPIAGAAMAAKIGFLGKLQMGIVAATGIAQAGSIISGGGSSSAGGSRGSATVASSGGAAPTPQTVYIDSLDPSAMYSGQSLIDLFEAFYNENDRRGKVFVVAR